MTGMDASFDLFSVTRDYPRFSTVRRLNKLATRRLSGKSLRRTWTASVKSLRKTWTCLENFHSGCKRAGRDYQGGLKPPRLRTIELIA